MRTGRPKGTGTLSRDAKEKRCPACRLVKLIDDFGKAKNTADGRYHCCIACVRSKWLMRTYDIDAEHFDLLVAEQGGLCPICKNPLQPGKASAVDHSHYDGSVRGVLCTSCNVGLGHFRENPEYFLAAINYLKLAEERSVKDMRKKCLKCGEPELLAMVTIKKAVPLADRNGTIKIGGQKLGQVDLKNAWDKIGGLETAPDQDIRGPIVCGACETEHFYVVGDSNPLRIGSVDEARSLGYDELRSK